MFQPTGWVSARRFCGLSLPGLAFGFALLLTLPARAQSGGGVDMTGTNGRHTIQGRIYFPSGRSADSRLKVRLENLNSGDLSVLADSKGEFTFAGLAPGNYTVVIEGGDEFETTRESVYIDTEARSRRATTPTIPRVYSVTVHLQLKRDLRTSKERLGVIDAALATVPTQAKQLYERALEAGRAGHSEQAIQLLKSALTYYPEFAHALNELGVQYLRLGQPDRAAEALRSAIKLAPNSFTPLLNYGIALLNKKEFQEASSQLRAAIRLKDSSPTAHMYLGIALVKLRSYDEAERELHRAISVGGQNLSQVHYYLGGIYWMKKEFKRAADELEKYLQLEPNAPDAGRVRETIKELRIKIQT